MINVKRCMAPTEKQRERANFDLFPVSVHRFVSSTSSFSPSIWRLMAEFSCTTPVPAVQMSLDSASK